jgi:hypothetical protein
LRISENMAHRVVPAHRFGGAAGFGFSPATMALRGNMAGADQSERVRNNADKLSHPLAKFPLR